MSPVATVITLSDLIDITPLSGSTPASISIALRVAVRLAQACRTGSVGGTSSVGGAGRASSLVKRSKKSKKSKRQARECVTKFATIQLVVGPPWGTKHPPSRGPRLGPNAAGEYLQRDKRFDLNQKNDALSRVSNALSRTPQLSTAHIRCRGVTRIDR